MIGWESESDGYSYKDIDNVFWQLRYNTFSCVLSALAADHGQTLDGHVTNHGNSTFTL